MKVGVVYPQPEIQGDIESIATIARAVEARIVCEELLAASRRIDVAPGATPVYATSIFTHRLERLELAVE